MMSMFELWFFLTVLPGLDTTCSVVSFLLGILMLPCTLLWFLFLNEKKGDPDQEMAERATPFVLIGWALVVLSTLITVAAPSEDQVYVMVGGAYATNIEGMNELPENAVKAINTYLEKVSGE